ncbi:MAG: cell division protein FtsA [Halarcobacter ebronensis]
MKIAGLSVNNFILDGYAAAISVLDEQQKKFGATVINIGSTTTEFVCYRGHSMIYNGFIPVGSNHITNDLSVMLHTPPLAAEKIKTEYGDLLKTSEELTNKKIRTPRIGDEKNSSEVSLEYVQTIVHARVEETLSLVKKDLKKSGIHENLGAGIVLTGGMSKLNGLKELTTLVFDNFPTKISNPVNIENGYLSFEDSKMATIVGILLYSLEPNRGFELDSNKNLIKKRKTNENTAKMEDDIALSTTKEKVVQKEQPKVRREQDISASKTNPDSATTLTRLPENSKKKGVGKIWNMITEWF